MADEYFYMSFGIPRGPFSWAEFVELAKNGKITSKTSCIVNDNPSVAAPVLFGDNWAQIESIQQAANESERKLLEEKRAKLKAERQEKQQQAKRDKQLRNVLRKKPNNAGMFGKLLSLFGLGKSGNESAENAHASTTLRVHLIAENEPRPHDGWYKIHNSKWPNLCQWAGRHSNEWKQLATRITVSGTSNLDYQMNFFMLASAPDFRLALQREPDNPYDRNAIVVLGFASIDGQSYSLKVGYLPKETSQALANLDGEISAVPECVWLPMDDCNFGLRITILQRSQLYLKRLKAN